MTAREPGNERSDELSIRPPAGYEAPDVVTVVYQYAFRLLEWRWLKGMTSRLNGVFRRCTPEFAEPFKLPPGGGSAPAKGRCGHRPRGHVFLPRHDGGAGRAVENLVAQRRSMGAPLGFGSLEYFSLFDSFRNQIDRLVRAYRLGVGLVFCYAINLIVWKFSLLGPTGNLQIAGALFTFIGLFFVAVPRRFVQHLWAGYSVRCAAATGKPCDGEVYKDVLSSRDRRFLGILQLLCIGGWFDVFYDIPMNPAHYIGLLFKT